MYPNLIITMGVLLILLLPRDSNASPIRTFFKFTQDDSLNNRSIQVAPSPSPVSSVDSNFGGGSGGTGDQVPPPSPSPSPLAEPNDGITDERCEISSSIWCRDLKNMIACLPGSGPQGSFLIVQNDEENSLTVNYTILPQNTTFGVIELQKHQAKKINTNVGGGQSVVLNAGNGDCVIHMGSPAPEDNIGYHIPSDPTYVKRATYVKPMHGAYLLVLIVLISGGACACFKLRKRERHLDGVQYQELEMGQPESLSAVKAETGVGWDQDWDDDWDEEKAVKSPGRKHISNGQPNGHASRPSNDDGWGNDWDE